MYEIDIQIICTKNEHTVMTRSIHKIQHTVPMVKLDVILSLIRTNGGKYGIIFLDTETSYSPTARSAVGEYEVSVEGNMILYLPPLVLIRILSYTYNLKQKFQQSTENTKCQQSPNMASQLLIG